MREALNCAEKCEKRLIVWICAGNGLKCENMQETAKSAIPHPPHFIFVSGGMTKLALKQHRGLQNIKRQFTNYHATVF